MSGDLELRKEDCEGVYLDDAEYDEYIEALAEKPQGSRR